MWFRQSLIEMERSMQIWEKKSESNGLALWPKYMWGPTVHGVAKSWTWLSDWTELRGVERKKEKFCFWLVTLLSCLSKRWDIYLTKPWISLIILKIDFHTTRFLLSCEKILTADLTHQKCVGLSQFPISFWITWSKLIFFLGMFPFHLNFQIKLFLVFLYSLLSVLSINSYVSTLIPNIL